MQFSELSNSVLKDYACERSNTIFNLYNILNEEMNKTGMFELFEKIELPLLRVLAKMELEGIALNVEMLERILKC